MNFTCANEFFKPNKQLMTLKFQPQCKKLISCSFDAESIEEDYLIEFHTNCERHLKRPLLHQHL
jgi:hypothetical protein